MMNNLLLGICIIIAVAIFSGSYEDAKKLDNINKMTISVKGYSKKDIISDYATWSGGYNISNPDLKTAYSDIQQIQSKVREFFNNMGVEDKHLEFSSINTETIYEEVKDEYGYKPTNKILEYKLRQSVTIELNNVDMIEKISKISTNLIQDGINFYSNEPQYFYSKIEELKLEMLASAARDAKQRAENLAENTDAEVGNLISASQGVFQITAKNSNEVSSYGIFDTYNKEKTISAVISAEFEVK